MKERPILMCGEMVRAILGGHKTQTRRVFKHPENYACLTGDCPHSKQTECDETLAGYCKYGQPGDRLWVKETFAQVSKGEGIYNYVRYKADEAKALGAYGCQKWKPSIFMPRALSRITLEIVSVRVEQVQEITEADAKAEGCDPVVHSDGAIDCGTRKTTYAKLWDRINGKTYPWSSNPFCFVLTFKRL